MDRIVEFKLRISFDDCDTPSEFFEEMMHQLISNSGVLIKEEIVDGEEINDYYQLWLNPTELTELKIIK